MSGGQRQCVAIARAAGFAEKLIILDEPTAAFGVQETAKVEDIIKGLKQRGVPLIIISHNLRQVFDLVDRIWVFRQGRIICNRRTADTTPQEIVGLIHRCHCIQPPFPMMRLWHVERHRPSTYPRTADAFVRYGSWEWVAVVDANFTADFFEPWQARWSAYRG
jgi:ABC-type sugar transport system ATPase subunit